MIEIILFDKIRKKWLLTGEDEKIKMASEENKTIEKVVEELDEMSADENERLEAYKRKLAIIDYNTSIDMAHKEGRREGMQEGRKEGRKEGEKIGREYNIPYNIPIDVDTIEKGYPILCA